MKPTEPQAERSERDERDERQGDRPGARLFLSASAVSAIVSALTTVLSSQVGGGDKASTERVRAEILSEVEDKFVARGVDEARWTYYTQGVEQQLRSIAAQLTAIDGRTANLPVMAAKIELLERR